MRFEESPALEHVKALVSNGPVSNLEIRKTLKGSYSETEIDAAISNLFTGNNAGKYELERGTSKIKQKY